jgi:hypothetical protein
MARWKKTLARMLTDTNPRNYSYDDAATILANLGFVEAPNSGTSHRKWRMALRGRTVHVALVAGHGTLKPGYIRDMVAVLRDGGLVPPDLET